MTPQEKLAALPDQWDEMAPQYEGDVRLMLTTCAQELRLRLKALSEHGEVVVTTDQAGRCVAVTRQDSEGRILSTIWEAPEHGGGGEAVLRRIVAEADTHPFNPIGHVIEHVVPEARNLHPPTPSAPTVKKPLLSEGGAGCHDCDGYQDEGVFCPTCGTNHGEDSSPPSAPAVDDVVRRNDDGSLDEVHGTGDYHLEQMDTDHWSLRLGRHLIGFHSKRAIRADIIENDLPAAALSGVSAPVGVEAPRLSDSEFSALDGLQSNLEHEAGDVYDSAPDADDDEDAYWAYHSWHAIKKLRDYAALTPAVTPKGEEPVSQPYKSAASEDGLTAVLRDLRPEFGAPGTRDEDVRRQQQAIDEAIRRRAASGQGVEGWKLVPVVPTEQMTVAGFESDAWDRLVDVARARNLPRHARRRATQEKGNG